MTETNALAYYENSKITDKKSFKILGPGTKDINIFLDVIYDSGPGDKLARFTPQILKTCTSRVLLSGA